MVKLSKKENLLRWLEGQRRAGRVLEQERRKRLAHMTPRERLETFSALCDVFRPFSREKQEQLDRIKFRRLVEVRRLFQRASERWRNERPDASCSV